MEAETLPFYTGSVADAVAQSSSRNCTFLVFIYDDSEPSNRVEQIFASTEIAELIRTETVAIRLRHDSPDTAMFAQLFPIKPAPSVYLIRNGVLRDRIAETITQQDVLARVRMVVQTPIITDAAPREAQNTQSLPIPSSTTSDVTAAIPSISSPTITSSPSTRLNANEGEGESSGNMDNERTKQERLRKLIEESRKKREAEEKEKERQREINRRNDGKSMQNLQRELKEKEAKKITDELAKEKREADEARRRVREQIAQDKAERATRRQLETEERRRTQAIQDGTGMAMPTTQTQSLYANVSIRLFDGSTIRNKFNAVETLADIRKWISEHRTDGSSPFILLQTYPHRTFTIDDEIKTLAELDLSPSGTLILISKNIDSVADNGEGGIIWNALSTGTNAVWGIINGVTSLASSVYEYATANTPVTTDRVDSRVFSENGSSSSSNEDTKSSNRRPIGRNIATLSSTSSNERSDRDPRPTYNGNSTNQM